MTPPSRTKVLLAVLATGLLAVSAVATVAAKPGDDGSANAQDRRDAAQERKDAAQEHREAAKEQHKEMKEERKELRDEIKEKCHAAEDNSTLKERCKHLQDAVKARRVAHALLTAIRVHERELGRVDFRIAMLQERIASGNLTANQTAEAQARLSHLEQRHDKLVEKIKDEQAKLAALRDRWSEVKDHLKDREEQGEDDGGVPAEPSGSESSTTAAA